MEEFRTSSLKKKLTHEIWCEDRIHSDVFSEARELN